MDLQTDTNSEDYTVVIIVGDDITSRECQPPMKDDYVDSNLYIDDIEVKSLPDSDDEDSVNNLIIEEIEEELITIPNVEDDVTLLDGNRARDPLEIRTRDTHPCPKCEFKGKTLFGLRRHQVNIHSDKPYPCFACDFVTDYISKLKIHMRYNHTKDPQNCAKCGFQRINTSDYNHHNCSEYSEGNNYSCCKCSHKAGSFAKLKRHERMSHTISYKDNDCTYCGYVAKKPHLLKKHISECHRFRLIDCRHCSFSTKDFQKLESHIISKHGNEKPFVCPHCRYGADSFAKLKLHYRICVKLKFLI